MEPLDFILSSEPAPADVQYLEDRIYDFNSATTGITNGAWLTILVRDERERIVAGLCGNTWSDCLEIRQLWVDEPRRNMGLGTQLLAAAEYEARRRGCRTILLMTFTFQAPAFYFKHGFNLLARANDHPRGHANLLLQKQI